MLDPPLRTTLRQTLLLITCLLASLRAVAVAAGDSSTFCYSAPHQGTRSRPTTTLHKSSTSTELEVVNVQITYTVTGQVPDHTITEHTRRWSTETVEEFWGTYTSTYWDGTVTESLQRPTITIVLPSIPKELRDPYMTHTSTIPDWRRDAQKNASPLPSSSPDSEEGAGDLLPHSRLTHPTRYDTMVCETIFYTTRTLTLTSVIDVVNSGQPKRTISVLMTHTDTTTVFVTPPAAVETTTRTRHYLTFTTTFAVVTAGMIPENWDP